MPALRPPLPPLLPPPLPPPLSSRCRSLRAGNKISVIENLAATQDQFDSLDLSDNDIRKLECMAVLPRVKQLLVSNNRINRVAESLGRAFPKLERLVLTNNAFLTLKELEPLAQLRCLSCLSLVDNPVTKVAGYRAFVIALLPTLRLLDFKKVKPAERQAAEEMYGAAKRQRTSAGDAAAASSSNTFEPGAAPDAEGGGARPKAEMTPEQVAAVKAAIENASSLEEVARLEKLMKAGNFEAVLATTTAAAVAPAEGGDAPPAGE